MDTNKILQANLLDLVFDGRNKDYGAYELRATYPERIKKSLIIIITFAGLVFAGAVLGRSMKSSHRQQYTNREIVIENLKEEEKKIEQPIEKRQPEPEQQTKTIAFTPPVITNEPVDQPPPEQAEFDSVKIDTKTQDGKNFDGTVDDKPVDKTGILDVKPDKESDDPLIIVEVPAKFIGNWESFLRRNLRPEVATDNNAPEGIYRVIIQFVVDKEGNVSDIKPLTNVGYGMEEEAMRVIRKATKWEPAIQNGYKAKAYHKQPITFQIGGEE